MNTSVSSYKITVNVAEESVEVVWTYFLLFVSVHLLNKFILSPHYVKLLCFCTIQKGLNCSKQLSN